MKKYLFLLFALFLSACDSNDSKVDASAFSKGTTQSSDIENVALNIDTKSYAGLEDVFKNTSTITSDGKKMLIVFGRNNCPYCEKLKKDIKSNQALRAYLKDNFKNYYINMSYSKDHLIKFGGFGDPPQDFNINTRDLSSRIYDVYGTPTLIFNDRQGKTVLKLPGYVTSDILIKVLKFIHEDKYKEANNQVEIMKLLTDYVNKE